MITYRVSTYTAFFTIVLVLISAKNVNIKNVIKFIYRATIVFVVLHVILYLIYYVFKVGELEIWVRVMGDKKFNRHSFFFGHPNIFAMYVFWTLAMYYYVNYKKLNKIVYIFTAILIVYVYIFPNSRTGALVMAILLITTMLAKMNLFKLNKLNLIYIVTVIGSIICIFMISNRIVMIIDSILNTRISLGYIIYNKYGINLFGTDITKGTGVQAVNGKYFSSIKILDSLYYSLFLNYGIVAFAIMIFITLKAIKYYTVNDNEENISIRIALFVWILYSLCETSCLNPTLGFPILLLKEALFSNDKKR